MRAKEYTEREFERLLKANGYTLDRAKGDHNIWTNGQRTISVTAGRPPNKMVIRRLIKENNLKEDI